MTEAELCFNHTPEPYLRMMKDFIENILNSFTKTNAPPVISGARNLIRQFSEEEAKIEASSPPKVVSYVSVTPESIASIVEKYGNRDIYKDVYKFIQA